MTPPVLFSGSSLFRSSRLSRAACACPMLSTERPFSSLTPPEAELSAMVTLRPLKCHWTDILLATQRAVAQSHRDLSKQRTRYSAVSIFLNWHDISEVKIPYKIHSHTYLLSGAGVRTEMDPDTMNWYCKVFHSDYKKSS